MKQTFLFIRPVLSKDDACRVILFVTMVLLVIGCHQKKGEVLEGDDLPLAASLQKARNAIGSREELMAAQLAASGDACIEKAEQQRSLGSLEQVAFFESAALTCYTDAVRVCDTISRARTLDFSNTGVFGTLHTRSWDYSKPWEKLGSAEGLVTVEKNLMVQFEAAPDFQDEQTDVLAAFSPGAIQYLNLGQAAQISDAAMDVVSRMKGLTDISLFKTEISDKGLAFLTALPYLRHVNLMGTKATPEGISMFVAKVPGVKEIAIEGVQVVDKTMWGLQSCSRLERLICREPAITDVGLSHLVNIPNLRFLWIGGKRITDIGAMLLPQLENAEEIILFDTAVTAEGLLALQSAMPKCNISAY